MQNLNIIFIKAKEKKYYNDILEFRSIIEQLIQANKNIVLDWDDGAGEEWARLIQKEVGVICMIHTKIGVAFVRHKYLNREAMGILNSLVVEEVLDYNSEDWYIDLSELKDKTPEVSWNVSPHVIDTESMSLNDLYFATV